MKCVVQVVSEATVEVGGKIVGKCGHGMLLLVGIHHQDTLKTAAKLAEKIAGLRIFPDRNDKINLCLKDLPPSPGSRVLAISNFTLYGDVTKSRRPSFTSAASFEDGRAIFDHFLEQLEKLGIEVETGEYGAKMEIQLTNTGPITLVIEV